MDNAMFDAINEIYKEESIISSTSLYDESFSNQFNHPDFYAKPKSTKIYLNIGTNNSKNEHLVGNAIVMNTKISNQKIPVYSYNSDIYAKYLNGKKIITGIIAFRKTTVDRIISLVKLGDKSIEYQNELKKNEESINRLTDLLKNGAMNAEEKNKLSYFLKQKENSYNLLLKDKESFLRKKTGLDISDDRRDLLYLRDLNKACNPSIKIEYESELTTRQEFISDILFVEKEQDISIDKNDIIEIYSFIGNPTQNL